MLKAQVCQLSWLLAFYIFLLKSLLMSSLVFSFSFPFFFIFFSSDYCGSQELLLIFLLFWTVAVGSFLPLSEHRWNLQLIQTQNFRICRFSLMQLCPWEALSAGKEQPTVVRTMNSPLNHNFQSLDVDPASTDTECYWCKCWYVLTAICQKFWLCIIWVDSENYWKQKSIYSLQV